MFNCFYLVGYLEILIVFNVVENGKFIGLVDVGVDWYLDLFYMFKFSLGVLLYL